MYCPGCGNNVNENNVNCPVCGVNIQSALHEQEKTAGKMKIIIAVLVTACIILGAVALIVIIPSLMKNSENDENSAKETDTRATYADTNREYEHNAVSLPDTIPENISNESSKTDTAPVQEAVSLPENSFTQTNELNYDHLKIPGNTYSFVNSLGSVRNYCVADVDGDTEFELVTVGDDYEFTLYNYDWDNGTYTKTGSAVTFAPGVEDIFAVGEKDGYFLIRVYNFSPFAEESSIAGVYEAYLDVNTFEVVSMSDSDPSYTTARDKIWYERDYNEILLFDPQYDFTEGVILTDLESRKLTEDYLNALYEAYGGEGFKSKNDFLDDLSQELAALKGYIFEDDGEHWAYYKNLGWYSGKYYQPYESVRYDSSYTASLKQKHPKFGPLGAYNIEHYWNGDDSQPSPLSHTYEYVNFPLIDSMKSY